MPEDQTAITSLKSYPKDTVGHSLVTNIPTAKEHKTVGDIMGELEKTSGELESVNYVYIVTGKHELKGIVSIKELLRWDNETPLSEIMKKEYVAVHPYTRQEKAAYLALQNNIKAIPIIDKDNKFLGVITSDKILGVMYDELTNDLFRFAGLAQQDSANDDVMKLSIFQALKHRVPWILLGLLGGMLIAQVIGQFEATLEQNITLAGFIPLMVYMSNAVGQQTSAFLIRDFAYGTSINIKKYFFKQAEVIVFIAIVMATILTIASFVLTQSSEIAKVLGVALFSTIISSILTGFYIPYLFVKLKQDPANASGPIGTVLQDFMSVVIYLTIATLLL